MAIIYILAAIGAMCIMATAIVLLGIHQAARVMRQDGVE